MPLREKIKFIHIDDYWPIPFRIPCKPTRQSPMIVWRLKKKKKNSKDLSFIVILVADSHDACEYIIILKCSLMYNLFSEFYCR